MALGIAGVSALVSVPTSAGAAGTHDTSAASRSGYVHGGHSVWERVDPFSGKKPWTTIEGEAITATCKRWGADGKWWYWVRFDIDQVSGHVAGDATNIKHSWLDKCS
ncbi:hypothetical protein [Embleya hyalina]|uniref:hypothetical protein n=1 Tax=Embleya hyalina TaxID=516124 RepID=UPI000F84DF1C|nr:hypothetical protein [Embleya hyalina]